MADAASEGGGADGGSAAIPRLSGKLSAAVNAHLVPERVCGVARARLGVCPRCLLGLNAFDDVLERHRSGLHAMDVVWLGLGL